MDLEGRLKTGRAVARLNEFFDKEDLLLMYEEFKKDKIDLDVVFRALDGQVRYDYLITESEPNVCDYLKRMRDMYGTK